MKKIFIVFALIMLTLLAYLYFYTNFSDEAITGKKNLTNIRKLEIGMDSTEVLQIMGKPTYSYEIKGKIYYNYPSVPFSSESYGIGINASSGEVFYIANVD